MAVQKVRIDVVESGAWAVYHSTSDTLFSPVFYDELVAQIFAVYYGRRRCALEQYTESAQQLIASAILAMVDEVFPEKDGVRVVPDDKCAQLNPPPDYYDERERADWVCTAYSVDELIADLDRDYDGTHADLIMEWLKAYLPAVQKGAEANART